MLRYVATLWIKLENGQIFRVTFWILHYVVLVRPRSQHFCTSACALGPLVTCQGPGAHKHRHVELKMLRAFGQPVQHMSQFLLTSYFQRSPVIFMTIAPLIVNLLFRSSNYIVLSKNSCLSLSLSLSLSFLLKFLALITSSGLCKIIIIVENAKGVISC